MEIRQEKDGSCSVIYSGCSDTGPSEASLVVVVDNLSPSIFESEVESNSIILGARTEEETSKFEFRFGSLRCSRWMCSAKNKLWWMTPSWGKSLQHIPPETQFLLAEMEQGDYAILLPLIDNDSFSASLGAQGNSHCTQS
eukprot:jgi/Picsp_1/6528/NSC_03871-R1_stachyose synthase